MSHRHYGGDPQRSHRHQQYDPFLESDRYGHVRRDGREIVSRNPYQGGGYGPSSISRQQLQQGYGGSSRNQPGQSYGGQMSRPRESGFPSGLQQSDVWRGKESSQQRPSRQTATYTHSVRDDQGGSVWGGQAQNPTTRYVQNPAYKSSGQMGMGGQQSQPVFMMVPQGSNGMNYNSGVVGLLANPFSSQRQGGMPVIIPAAGLNPNVFDQHVIGNGQYAHGGGGGSRPIDQRSGRSGDRGFSAHGREKVPVSRGRATPPGQRRRSPGRVFRNSIYRKSTASIPPNSVPRKRVFDRPDFGDRKRLKQDTAEKPKAASSSSTLPKKPSANQKRKEKRKKDAIAKAAAAAAASKAETAETKSVSSPEKNVEKEVKEVKKDGEGSSDSEKKETPAEVEVKKPDDNDEVVVIDDEDSPSGKGDEEKKRKSRYDDFPPALLVCKVCQKSMNDGASFESHLSGRAHTALVKIVEERFQKRADLLMIESRLAEEEIGIELERQRRAGKTGGNSNKSNNHCKMCDCTYTVNWGTHKISLGHRILKEFLHPRCHFCDANFVHRMDWLNHLFGLTHLRRISEQRQAGKDTSSHESPTQEELFTINLEMNQEERPSNFITIRNLDWKVPTSSHIKDILQDETEFQVPDGEIILPEEHDGTVVVGRDAIIATTGFCCKVCRTYMTQEKDVDPHCMGKSHFGMYVSHLKKLMKIQEEQKEATTKEKEELLKGNETEVNENDEQHNEPEEKDKCAGDVSSKDDNVENNSENVKEDGDTLKVENRGDELQILAEGEGMEVEQDKETTTEDNTLLDETMDEPASLNDKIIENSLADDSKNEKVGTMGEAKNDGTEKQETVSEVESVEKLDNVVDLDGSEKPGTADKVEEVHEPLKSEPGVEVKASENAAESVPRPPETKAAQSAAAEEPKKSPPMALKTTARRGPVLGRPRRPIARKGLIASPRSAPGYGRGSAGGGSRGRGNIARRSFRGRPRGR